MLYLTMLPALLFWVLLIVGRHELGWRWIVALLTTWVLSILLIEVYWPASAGGLMIAAQSLLVIIMVFKVFGLDIPRSM